MISCAPPVTVFDTKQGYWQKRKREWKEIGLHSEDGRAKDLIGGGGLALHAAKHGMTHNGTSTFDPFLCEILYNWYSPPGGMVYDPFAGGSVRGIVAEMLGRYYIGIDLSQRQIDANQMNADAFGVCPAWHCDDSKNADKYLPDGSADLVFSCPPYHNLEKYSDHPLDLSNMNYADFSQAYGEIISAACRKLNDDRFAVFVVGDVRDSKGAYRDFISLTKRLFIENGLYLYNESILLEQYGTVPMRAGRLFKASRKTAKVHQNVLVFFKGDMRKIKSIFSHEIKKVDLSKYQ